MKTIKMNSKSAVGAIVMALFFWTPILGSAPAPERGGGGFERGGGGAARAPAAPRMEAPRTTQAPRAPVERSFHGSVGHANVGVVHPQYNRGVQGNFHRNYDVEVNHGFGRYYGGGLHIGAFVPVLPFGYSTYYYGGVPYYYDDGTYYQQGPSGYEVVNPPAGAEISGPPSGAIPVTANGQTYYYDYVSGNFYMQQDNGFAVVGAPLGAAVPELPSGATQTVINGTVYYVFNNVYYQPMMQNGVTMYVTVAPQ